MIEFRKFHRLLDLLYYYNELSELFGQLDINNDKRISFNKFRKDHELIGQSDSDEDRLQEEFDSIDSNHGGHILFDEVC